MTRRHLVDDEHIRPSFYDLQRQRHRALVRQLEERKRLAELRAKPYVPSPEDTPVADIPANVL